MIRRVELGAPSSASLPRSRAPLPLVLAALALGAALFSPAAALADPAPTCGVPGDTGLLCTAGTGACLSIGAILCGDDGLYTCAATPGLPQPEICGDTVDSDCDGDPDNGCGCDVDADCGDAQSGMICTTTHTCLAGCHAAGNGCAVGSMCSAQGNEVGECVGCMADSDCGKIGLGLVCEAFACIEGCRLDGSNACPTGQVCSTAPGGLGVCEPIVVGSSSSSSGGSGLAAGPDNHVSSAAHGNISGSASGSSSSSSGDPALPEPSPDVASGATGFHCATLPGHVPGSASWLFGAALAALAGRRRRRAA
jgi:hypothetical protein